MVCIDNLLFVHCSYESIREHNLLTGILNALKRTSSSPSLEPTSDSGPRAKQLKKRLEARLGFNRTIRLRGILQGQSMTRADSTKDYRLGERARLFLSLRFLYSLLCEFKSLNDNNFIEFGDIFDIMIIGDSDYAELDPLLNFFWEMYNDVYSLATNPSGVSADSLSQSISERYGLNINEYSCDESLGLFAEQFADNRLRAHYMACDNNPCPGFDERLAKITFEFNCGCGAENGCRL